MIVQFILRSPGTGYSIEEQFGAIQRALHQWPGLSLRVSRLPYISRTLGQVGRNLRYVARLSADVFHVTGDVHYVVLALPPERTILTIHDCVTLEQNRRRPLRYALFWLLWFYWPIRRAGVVTAVSEKTRQDLLRYVGRVAEKVVVIPNGCDPNFAPQPKVFDDEWPVLLQIGTAPNKNLFRLIEALENIRCTLVIVGPLTATVRADLIRRRITYRHYADLSRAAIRQQYHDCDIVTFVSTYEGFGMPILEANAVGRAILTSAIEPLRSVAGEAALLVDPTDITAIRQGILRLIHDADYRQGRIEAGFENVRRYGIDATAARYADSYASCVMTEPAAVPAL